MFVNYVYMKIPKKKTFGSCSFLKINSQFNMFIYFIFIIHCTSNLKDCYVQPNDNFSHQFSFSLCVQCLQRWKKDVSFYLSTK